MWTHRSLALLSAAAAVLLAAGPAIAQQGTMPLPEGRVMLPSQFDFNGTVSRVKQAIGGENMMVVAEADHQQMLSMVGVQSRGMLTVEFFHPRYGRVIFENNQAAGMEVPLRLVVMEGDMGTMVSYDRPSYVFAKYRGLEQLGRDLDGVLERITAPVRR